jgi:hypothetical protein
MRLNLRLRLIRDMGDPNLLRYLTAVPSAFLFARRLIFLAQAQTKGASCITKTSAQL